MTLRHLFNLTPLARDRLVSLPLLVLYLTDGCNSRCVTCDIWKNPRRSMRADLIDGLLHDAAALGVRWVVLSGGEAMQHPEWATIADRFRALGTRLMLLTNGLLVRRHIQAVIDTVDDLIVSLDGGKPETYAAIRGVDAFDLVLSGMQSASHAGKRVTVRTTVSRANFREMPLIVDRAKAVDVHSVSFLPVDVSSPFAFGPRFISDTLFEVSSGDALPIAAVPPPDEHQPPAAALSLEECAELEALITAMERTHAVDFASGRIAESPAKLRRMAAYFRALHTPPDAAPAFPPVRCNAPRTTVIVEVDGRVRPCYFLPTMGRVRLSENITLSDAVNSEAAVEMRRAQRRGERPECTRCVCPLYKSARDLLTL
jgi:radical SAM protein with 4Fe4S-binding SPASM domain